MYIRTSLIPCESYIFPLIVLVYLHLLSNFQRELRKTHQLCSRVRYDRSTSSNVVDIGSNRKRLRVSLLVINNNLGRYKNNVIYNDKSLYLQ